MPYRLEFAPEAQVQLLALERDTARLRLVRKCLARLEKDPRHPGLHSHEFKSKKGAGGEKVWEAYVDMSWRVFWHYGAGKDTITVVAITPHP